MKALTIVVLALVATCAFSSSLRSGKAVNLEKVQQIKQNKWGKALLSLGQLQMLTEGPIDDFFAALDELLRDVQGQLEDEIQYWELRTNDHQNIVTDLENQIQAAEFDVASTRQKIDTVLFPRTLDLEHKIEVDQGLIAQNEEIIAKETAIRNDEHAYFEYIHGQQTEAINSIDESLKIINRYLQGETPSLAQIKTFGKNIKKIQEKVVKAKIVEAPFITALVNLASNLSPQDAEDYRQVSTNLNELREYVVSVAQKLQAAEDEQQAAFDERINALQAEINEWQARIDINTTELSQTNEQIQQAEQFWNKRRNDIERLSDELQVENDIFAELQTIHQETEAELREELAVVQQVVAIFKDVEFSSYIKGVLNRGEEL